MDCSHHVSMEAEEENLSVVLYGKNDLRVVKRALPEPRDDEVLLRMSSAGICGTDITLWTKAGFGEYQLRRPTTLGHETSGVVLRVGSLITQLQAGDCVAVEPVISCRYCDSCKTGKYNLCRFFSICGVPPEDGNMCRYKTVPADFCHRLPAKVSLEEGALCEPLAVAVHACRRGEISLGQTVLITGAGPIGLLTLYVAKSMGASKILVTDVNASRLRTALELGASKTLLIQSASTLLAEEMRMVLGDAPDVSIECSAEESSVSLALDVTKKGGKVVLVGIGAEKVSVPLLNSTVRQVDLLPIFCYANCFPAAISLLESGKGDLKRLITHHFPIEKAVEAFETARIGMDGAIKVLIHC